MASHRSSQEFEQLAASYRALHGEQAIVRAAGRANALLDAGDLPGAIIWAQVLHLLHDTRSRGASPRQALQ